MTDFKGYVGLTLLPFLVTIFFYHLSLEFIKIELLLTCTSFLKDYGVSPRNFFLTFFQRVVLQISLSS